MTGDEEFIGHLEGYLETFDGETPLPEHVRHAIHAALPGTRQVRPRRGPLRGLTMLSSLSGPARWGIATATIVVVVALGAAVLNPNRSQGIGAAPSTPVPSPAVTPVPTPSLLTITGARTAPCRNGDTKSDCIAAGTYRLKDELVAGTSSVEIPAGWFEYDVGPGSEGILVDRGADAPDGSGWGLLFATVGTVPHDPCDPRAGTYLPTEVDSVPEFVAAMSSWPGFNATTPVPIIVGGQGGQLVELTSARTPATCSAGVLWKTPQLSNIDLYPLANAAETRVAQFRVLDVGGRLLVIRTTDFADPSPFEIEQGVKPDTKRHVSDQAAMHAILDSIRFGPTTQP